MTLHGRPSEEALLKAGALQHAILNSANFSSIATDEKGVIQIFNVGAERMLGYAAAEVVNRNTPADISDGPELVERARALSAELGTPIRPGFEALVFKASRGIEDIYELTYIRKDGSRFPAIVSVTALRDDANAVIGYLLIGTDNSARKQVEAERTRIANQLREQAAQLSELHRRKDEFLAMLSHELRSPLAPISNAVRLLGMQSASENEVQRQARRIIERQMDKLQHLVDDLLDVSRITTGRVQLRREPVAVNGVVEVAVETVRQLVEQRGHVLTVVLPEQPLWLIADAARLEQVFVNLLANAAKYTDEGGRMWLTVVEDDTECVVSVRDNGVGIPADLLPCVFELFTQGERFLDRSQGGLGIGLALAQRLTELHGGRIEAKSVVGEGSEFTVRLPMMAAVVQPRDTAAVAPAPLVPRPLRILVVDDQVDTVLSLSMLLSASGHDVRPAYDGPSAVTEALDYRPDVVLLDIGLPGLNGHEVARKLRHEPSLEGVVLVALTGYGQDSDRQVSREAGFDHHLVKPVSFELLRKILERVVASAL